MARNFRDVFRFITPAWLNDGSDGSRVLFSLSLLIDASVERFQQALLARFPGMTGASAQNRIGAERGVKRARGESDQSYAARLRAWRYPRGHRVRGNDFALLEQVRALFSCAVGAATIDANGTQCALSASGAESYVLNGAWDFDSRPSGEWSRFWLRLDGLAPNYEMSDPRYGLDASSQPQTAGIRGASVDDLRAIRFLLGGDHPWRPAGTQPEWLIVNPDLNVLTPSASWERWHRYVAVGLVTHAVPARSPIFAYVPLRAEHETYAGDGSQFYSEITKNGDKPLEILSSDAGGKPNFAGNAARWLPSFANGATGMVAGNPSSFPASIPMPHDGTELV